MLYMTSQYFELKKKRRREGHILQIYTVFKFHLESFPKKAEHKSLIKEWIK